MSGIDLKEELVDCVKFRRGSDHLFIVLDETRTTFDLVLPSGGVERNRPADDFEYVGERALSTLPPAQVAAWLRETRRIDAAALEAEQRREFFTRYSEVLFEALRDVRRTICGRLGIPVHYGPSNQLLQELIANQCIAVDDLRRVGVGPGNIERWGAELVQTLADLYAAFRQTSPPGDATATEHTTSRAKLPPPQQPLSARDPVGESAPSATADEVTPPGVTIREKLRPAAQPALQVEDETDEPRESLDETPAADKLLEATARGTTHPPTVALQELVLSQLSSLAIGLDPRTSTELPDDHLVRRPEVRQALSYAVGFLERNGAESPPLLARRLASKRPSRSEGPARGGAPWTLDEEKALVDAFEQGRPLEDIATEHQRTSGGVRARLIKLGLLEP